MILILCNSLGCALVIRRADKQAGYLCRQFRESQPEISERGEHPSKYNKALPCLGNALFYISYYPMPGGKSIWNYFVVHRVDQALVSFLNYPAANLQSICQFARFHRERLCKQGEALHFFIRGKIDNLAFDAIGD